MNRLQGKRALITGGTTGIGLETARRFLQEGARVAITGTRSETLESARKTLGDDVLIVASDSGDVSGQQSLAKAIGQAFGELDILVVNAGIADLRPLESWDEVAFDRSLAINFKGPFFLVQALLPIFATPAAIVLTTSINSHIGMPTSSVYAASKAALLSLAKTFSGELLARGIRVNAISPGPIATPLHDKHGMPKDAIVAQVPARRFGDAAEVAQAIVFLASDEAAFTVGSELVIDGGMSTL